MIAGSIEIQLLANLARLQKDMDRATAMVGGAVGKMEAQAKRFQGMLSKIGVGVSVGALLLSLNSVIDRLAQLDDMAQKTGSSIQNLSRMQKVAREFGHDFGAIDGMLTKLSKGMATVDSETNKTNKALKALGINSRDASGKLRDPSEVAIEAAKKLQLYQDGANKVALVQDLMSKSAAEALPYLNDLADNIDRMKADTPEAAARAAALQDKIGMLRTRFQEAYETLAFDMLPSMLDFMDALNDTNKAGHDLNQDSAVVNWTDKTLLGLARVIDVLKVIPDLVRAVAGSFQAVWADIELLSKASRTVGAGAVVELAKGNNPWAGFTEAFAKRNKIVEEANKRYVDLWNNPANQTEQAMLARIAARNKSGTAASPYVSPTSGRQQLNYETGNDAAAKALESKYDALIKKSGDYLVQLQYENAEQEKLTQGQKTAAEIRQFLTENTASMTAQQRQLLESYSSQILALEKIAEAEKDRQERIASLVEWQMQQNEAAKAHSAGLDEATRAYDNLTNSTNDEITAITKQIEVLKYGARAATVMQNARLLEAAAAFEQNAAYAEQNGVSAENIKSMRDRAKALRELAAARGQLANLEYQVGQINKLKSFVESTWDSISDGLTNALFRGFENGKSFAENFFDTLKNTAKTTVLKFTTEFILSPMKAGLSAMLFGGSSAAMASGILPGEMTVPGGGGFGLGSLGGLSDILGVFKGGFAGMNDVFINSISGLGSKLIDYGFNGLGNLISQYSAQIANIAPFVPSVIQLLSGDIKGAAFSGAGAGLGFAVGGPVGAAIGSALGGLVGGAFGRKKNPRYTTAMTSIYGPNGLISGGQVNADGKDTAMFASNLTQLNNQFAKALGAVYEMFDKDIKRLQVNSHFSYKKGKQTIGGYSGSIDGRGFWLNGTGFGEDISAGFAEFAKRMMGEGLASALRSSSLPVEVRRAFRGVISSTVIQAIVGSFATLNGALELFKDKLDVTNLQLIAAANRTGMVGAQLAKVINGFSGDLANFYNLYYTDAEKITDVNKALTKQFTDLGLALPGSKEAFRDLVEGVDTTTVAGQDLFIKLLKLGPAFAQYMDAMDAQDQALQSQTDKLKELAEALDPNRFSTIADYNMAKASIAAGEAFRVPGYATGGDFAGGLRVVGERGMELEATGPARIFNANQTRDILSGRNSDLASLLHQMVEAIRDLQRTNSSENISIAKHQSEMKGDIRQLNSDGFIFRGVDAEGNEQILKVEVVA